MMITVMFKNRFKDCLGIIRNVLNVKIKQTTWM